MTSRQLARILADFLTVLCILATLHINVPNLGRLNLTVVFLAVLHSYSTVQYILQDKTEYIYIYTFYVHIAITVV